MKLSHIIPALVALTFVACDHEGQEREPLDDAMLTDHADSSSFAKHSEEDQELGQPECSNYCEVYTSYCAKFFYEFEDNDHCMAECATWNPGIHQAITGDNVGCRFELAVASVTNPKNCINAGPSSSVCIEPDCEDYCSIYGGTCGLIYGWDFEDYDDCVAQCGAWQPGLAYDEHGDTRGCRFTQALKAEQTGDYDQFCPDAGVSSERCVDEGPGCDGPNCA